MEPKINHGDIIALRECTVNDIQYGEIYAVVLDTIRTIKILRRGSTPDVLRYVPINIQNFDEQEFPVARILHIFAWIRRQVLLSGRSAWRISAMYPVAYPRWPPCSTLPTP